jgi:uncharacterized protein DUF3306
MSRPNVGETKWEHVMLHAQPLPAATRWPRTGHAIESEADSRRGAIGQVTAAITRLGIFVLGIACLLVTFMALALAQSRERANEAFDLAALPALDSIDAQTDIAVFLQSGVPIELHVAALRRAWTVDPAVRDFAGLEENDWDFDNPNSISGFGELGPEVDVRTMVAQILGEPIRLAALVPARPDERSSSSSLANLARRLISGAVH